MAAVRFLTASVMLAVALAAQDKAPPDSYRVDFQIKDEGAKARRYSLLLDAGGNGNFRIGIKTPVATTFGPNGGPTAYSYIDTGVNISARVRQGIGGKVLLNADIEISSAANAEKIPNPIISQIKTVVSSAITPRKPTLIASIEDTATLRKFDVEVTISAVE